MAIAQVKYEAGFTVVECWHCQMPFGITEYFERRRREDHQNFWCPAGHSQCYPQETKLEKEQRKSQMLADQVRMEREQREKAERQLKRVQKGVCPKCNRSFKSLERHMKTKHGC